MDAITIELTEKEREALREFLARDVSIYSKHAKNLPEISALLKLEKKVN